MLTGSAACASRILATCFIEAARASRYQWRIKCRNKPRRHMAIYGPERLLSADSTF